MCCVNLQVETVLANCLFPCPESAFSIDELRDIVQKAGNSLGQYVLCDITDESLKNAVIRYHRIFQYITEDRVALLNPQTQIPLRYFDFGYPEDVLQAIRHYAILCSETNPCTQYESQKSQSLINDVLKAVCSLGDRLSTQATEE